MFRPGFRLNAANSEPPLSDLPDIVGAQEMSDLQECAAVLPIQYFGQDQVPRPGYLHGGPGGQMKIRNEGHLAAGSE